MRVGSWLLLLLPFLALSELWAHEQARQQAPSAEQWEQLAPRVRALHRPGDLVTVAPRWAEPLLRYQLGDPYFPLELLGRTDSDSLKRAIVVSFMGQEDLEFGRWKVTQTLQTAPFVIRMYENPAPAVPKARLIDRIEPRYLEVYDGEPGEPNVCAFTRQARVSTGGLGGDPTLPATRFQCPAGGPHLVGVTTIDDEHFRPKRCIFAQPSKNGALSLVFHDVPLGKSLVGYAGLPWLISRDGVGTPIELAARLDGQWLGHHIVIDEAGFRRFEWDTRHRENQQAELLLTVSTANPDNRRLCFTLESR
jgi:hypothetical protein